MITTILTHTPVWVDGLFVYLVVMGIAALRPQTVSVTRLLIVPTLFVAMGLFMLVSGHAGLTAVLAWSLALMLALPLGILTSTPLLVVDRDARLVRRPGSAAPLIRNVGVFVLQYAVTVAAVLHPHQHATLFLLGRVVSGVTAGYFLGWTIALRRHYRAAPDARLGTASMRRSLKLRMVVAALALMGGPASASVGFSIIAVPQPGAAPLPVGVWYPSNAPASPRALGPVTQTVAQDAPVAPGPHALVVISHGNGGWFASHLDTAQALAVAGFVVAAPTHAGDNYRDQSHATDIAARPNQLRAVIDAMLTQWQGHAAIDPRRIGLFGFSAGGLSVLIAAGGVPDLALVAPYCATHTTGYVCTLIHAHPPADTAPPVWTHDPRVRAIVVAAPALGFAFGPTGLAGIHMPVQLWQADQDHILPPPDDVAPVLAGLRRGGMPVEFHPIPGADHWDFLAPCTPALAKLAPQICGEISGFDRAAFHRTFDADIVGFFRRTLATP